MLRELLQLVETAEGPLSLTDLGRQLNVDAPVLEAMLQHWVRKGRLIVEGRGSAGEQGSRGAGVKGSPTELLLSPALPPPCSPAGGGGGCGSCAGMTSCPFVARLPVTYRVNTVPRAALGPNAAD